MGTWVVERTIMLACDAWGRAVAEGFAAHLRDRLGDVALVRCFVVTGEAVCEFDGTPIAPLDAVRSLSRWEAAAELAAKGLQPSASGEIAVWLVGGGPADPDGPLPSHVVGDNIPFLEDCLRATPVVAALQAAGAMLGAEVVVGGLWRIEGGPCPPLERGWLLVGALREDGFLVTEAQVIAAAAEVLYQVVVTPLGRAVLQVMDQWVLERSWGPVAVVGVGREPPPGLEWGERGARLWGQAVGRWLLAPVEPPLLPLPELRWPDPPPLPATHWRRRVWSDLGALPSRMRQWQATQARLREAWAARVAREAPVRGAEGGTRLRAAVMAALEAPGAGSVTRAMRLAAQTQLVVEEAWGQAQARATSLATEREVAETSWTEAKAVLEESLAVVPAPTEWWRWLALAVQPWRWGAVWRAGRRAGPLVTRVEATAERLWQLQTELAITMGSATTLAEVEATLAALQDEVGALEMQVMSMTEQAAPGSEAWPAWLGPVPSPEVVGPAWVEAAGPLSRWVGEAAVGLPGALLAAGRVAMADVVPRTAEGWLVGSGVGVGALVQAAQPLGRPLAWCVEGTVRRLCWIGTTRGAAGPLAAEGVAFIQTGADDVVVMTALMGLPWEALGGVESEKRKVESAEY